jgi:enamine deaminase RidA (YjgF/YER057c/UK114 family)
MFLLKQLAKYIKRSCIFMSRKAYSAAGAVSVGPYSHAVESGDLIFLSGQTPIDSQ